MNQIREVYIEKIPVKRRAGWYDVKALVKKVTSAELYSIRVDEFNWSGDHGWLVELDGSYIDYDMYIEKMKAEVENVIRVGERAFWIGVSYGK